MKILSFLWRASRVHLLLAVLAGISSGIASVGLIAVIDLALKPQTASHSGSVWTLGWSFAALCLVKLATGFGAQVLMIRLAEQAIWQTRLRLSRQILSAPLRHLEEAGSPRLMAALTDDVGAITNAFIIIPLVCINLAVVAGCLAYLGWLSPLVLLTVVVLMAVGIVTYRLPIGWALRYFRRAREQTDALYGHFRALTMGAKELKLHYHRRQAFVADLLEPTAISLRSHNIAGSTIYAAAAKYGNILFFVFIGVLLFLLPGWISLKEGALTGATLTILFLMAPLESIMVALPAIGRAGVALRKIDSLGLSLTAQSDDLNLPAPARPNADWQQLELAGVTHSYRTDNADRDFTIGPLDLTLRRGELVFIIGGNGSGKTTFAKLLTGLYAPETGEIRLDGRAIGEENRSHYRQQFAAIFSDFYLFEQLLGLQNSALDEQARAHLRELQLDNKVQVKDGGLSTIELSQGQRKRLALLVAYLEDRPVYLFDEWAADQDPVFKEVFYDRILADLKMRGKTVIVISHDDRYHHVADRIIKLEYGKVEYDRRNEAVAQAAPAGQSVR